MTVHLLIDEFPQHMAADAKMLDEDEETGAKRYRYIRTGPDHFSLAFTYALLASMRDTGFRAWIAYMKWMRKRGSPWL